MGDYNKTIDNYSFHFIHFISFHFISFIHFIRSLTRSFHSSLNTTAYGAGIRLVRCRVI
jgi:hypothetical protein